MTRTNPRNIVARGLAAILLAACAALPLQASAAATVDYSDLWFNPSEAGWGANVIQQDDTLFVTLFVYGTSSQPTWYVASSVQRVGTGQIFSGTLYRTRGPYFGGAFTPGAVEVTPVGTLTFTASRSSAATLAYSVDGVPVSKSVVRQTWGTENIAGSYLGAFSGTWSNCGAGRDGYQENIATFQVSQDGIAIQIREDGANYTCNYVGSYAQSGRMGTIAGGGICSDGINQTFSASDVQMTRAAIGMQVVFGQAGACRFTGRMGAVRRGPP
ncbi:MAG: hypothetical protein ABIR98_05280 [Usitatibacter sp.]